MTHEDQGHYADKYKGVKIDPTISKKIKALAQNNTITCSSAHRAAKDLGVSPAQIGVQADLLELRISQCQMGLFGYGKGIKKIDPSIHLGDDLWASLEKAGKDKRISCALCWEMAARFKMKKLDMGSACEKLDLKIKPCQLGAF